MPEEPPADGVAGPVEPGTMAEAEPEAMTEAARGERRRRIAALKQELLGGDLYSAAEVAEILDVHPRTVGEYVREGRLRAFQLGGGWKISESALRAFVREQTQVSPSPATAPPAPSAGPVTHPIARALNDVLMTLVPTGRSGEAPTGGRGKGRGQPYRCSFCGKPQEQVRRLIAGPNLVFICDECVALCNEIIAEQAAKPQPD